MAYWLDVLCFRPQWLGKHMWNWVVDVELIKMLETAFGLNLEVQEVDTFLIDKIWKKIEIFENNPPSTCRQKYHG